MRASILLVAALAGAALLTAHAANTRGSLRVQLRNNGDDHRDLVKNYDSANSVAAVKGQMNDIDFDEKRSIHDIRAEIYAQLQQVRGALKSEFGKLEGTIKDRINAIFNVACKSSTDDQTARDAANNFAQSVSSSCWVAMKVECQLFDVQEFIHGHRVNLVNHVKTKLSGMVTSFNNYLTKNGLNCDNTPFDAAKCTDQASLQCRCNAKNSIDGMLGMHLQDGDQFCAKDGKCSPTVSSPCKEGAKDVAFDVLWAQPLSQQCAAFDTCVKSAPACSSDSSDFCHDQVDTDHSCVENHPAFNKDDDSCVDAHLGMLGILSYYGGDDDITSGQIGRVGRMVNGAFACSLEALDDSKLSCADAERDQDSHKCVDSACDCACACEKHHSDETEAKCAKQGGRKAGLPWVGAAPVHSDGDAAGHAATCGDSKWRTDNHCPAAVAQIA